MNLLSKKILFLFKLLILLSLLFYYYIKTLENDFILIFKNKILLLKHLIHLKYSFIIILCIICLKKLFNYKLI